MTLASRTTRGRLAVTHSAFAASVLDLGGDVGEDLVGVLVGVALAKPVDRGPISLALDPDRRS